MRKRTAVLITLLLAVGLLAGYWAGSRPEVAPLPDPAWTSQPASAGADRAARAAPVELSADERNNVEVYEKAAPAVVNVTSRAMEWSFFRGAVPVEGTGSGFLVDDDGHIVTNYHVIAGAQQIQVTLGDHRSFPARVVGADRLSDLAVLKIEAEALPTLPLGDSSRLRVGQKVLAIGNPFGFQGTLTTGVISALERSIETRSGALLDEAIQTDAAINQGNSGGPLLDSQGRVIGVNTLIVSPSGGSIGIGFAIPVNTLKLVLNDLRRHGRVRRAWLGLSGIDIGMLPGLAQELNLPVREGALVVEVARGGPADRAGLRGGDRIVIAGRYRIPVGGDIIVAINGEEVKTAMDVTRILYKKRPGESVTVTFYRDGEKRTTEVQLGERPERT